MSALCKGRDTMTVLPTGSGKSLIYQVLAMLIDRPVVTLFPLIALMQDQERSLQRNNVPVVRLDSTLGVRDRRAALERVREGGKLVILTTPETLESEDLKEALKLARPALLCVDEAHCISEWGHDFRPAYLRVGMERAALGVESVLALTATATPKVQDDIVGRLQMQKPAIITSPPYRDNLQLSVRNVPGSIKMAAAGKLIRRLSRPGIVYCATTKAVDEIFGALKRAGIPVARYHGRMTKTERVRAQKKFVQRRGRMVMVATSAFGMGIDKPNIRYIMHYQVPGSVEQYVQEIGRAGRDGRPARCVLLFDEADLDIQKRLAAKSHVNANQLEALGDAIIAWAEDGRDFKVEDVALSAQVVTTACRALCNQIEEAGLLERNSDRSLRAKVDIETLRSGIAELAQQFAVVQREDLRRINRIAEYALAKECRSVYMRKWFGEESPPECGRCDNCRAGQSGQPFRQKKKPERDRPKQHKRHRSRKQGQSRKESTPSQPD